MKNYAFTEREAIISKAELELEGWLVLPIVHDKENKQWIIEYMEDFE